MRIPERYTIEAGIVVVGPLSMPIIHEPEVHVPLVQGVDIGQAASLAEQHLCDAGIFIEKATYNGSKLIIPNSVPAHRISRQHGHLVFNDDYSNVAYRHLSKRYGTVLWTRSTDVIGDLYASGQLMDLMFSGETGVQERYLLLGAEAGKNSLYGAMPTPSYYVKITREKK